DTMGELKPVPLETPAAEAISDMHALAQSRHIELELHAEPNVWVRGDPPALRTLVRNLVDNAVRYTPESGKVEIHVRSTPAGSVPGSSSPNGSTSDSSSPEGSVPDSSTPSGGMPRSSSRNGSAPGGATLEVLDSGPGIPEADRARAFDR